MHSRLNEMENEGLIVVGRVLTNEWAEADKVREVAKAVDAWAKKLSLPLGLVYCGTTINWPDDVDMTAMVVGLVTYAGVGDEEAEDDAGTVVPAAMDIAQADKIPAEFWNSLVEEHGVEYAGELNVYLTIGGWTWVALEADGERLGVSAEDDGYRVIPPPARSKTYTMRAGYC